MVVLSSEPDDAVAVGVLLGSAAVASAALAALGLLRFSGVGRSARARASRLRALRRGAEVGAIVGIVGLLRVIDGLTPLTGAFVVAAFAVAEYVLSSGSSASR